MTVPVFNCECGLTDEQVMEDLSFFDLTGFESEAELQNAHISIFHSDEDEKYYWDDTDFYGTEGPPTAKEIVAITKIKHIKESQWRCNICPPWEQENTPARSTGKHGSKKAKYKSKNKSEGRYAKRQLKRDCGY